MTRESSDIAVVTRHAGSILVGQLAVMAFGVTDTVVAGRHSDEALAALSVGSAIYISVYGSLIGIVQALLPIYAELHGAKRPAEIGRTLRQTLYVAALLWVLGVALLLSPGPLMRWSQVPQTMQADTSAYLAVLAAAFAPSLMFRMFSTLNQALARPLMVTWVQIGSLALKIPLTLWFVEGGAGVPAMGVVGCAWATLVVNYLMFALALVLLRSQALYRPLDLWRWPEPPNAARIGHFLRMGLPSGVGTMVEVTSFTLMAVFIARLGTAAAASHQIAASVAAMLYMFPLSLGLAGSARVSYWLGAGDSKRAKTLIWKCVWLSASVALCCSATLFIASGFWAQLYNSSPNVVPLATSLLAWVALYHLADAVQAVSASLLRSLHITVAPMLIYGALLWCGGLGGGYWLAHGAGSGTEAALWFSPGAYWASGSLALWAVAALFVALLVYATKRSSSAN